MLFLTAATGAHPAETFTDEPIVSPDGSYGITVQYGERTMGTEWHITLSKNGRGIYRRTLPDKLDMRYVKVSWAPSSRAVLLGENYKAGMDLTLLRIAGRRVRVNHFDLGDRMSDKEERELPLRRELQSSAPVERVMWPSVKWHSPTRCTMLYILHGLGYEGEGDVTVDFHRRRPVLKTSHLRALTSQEYFNGD